MNTPAPVRSSAPRFFCGLGMAAAILLAGGLARGQVNTGHSSAVGAASPGNPTMHDPFNGSDPNAKNWDWPAGWAVNANHPAKLANVVLGPNGSGTDWIWLALDNLWQQQGTKRVTMTFTSVVQGNFSVANRTAQARPNVAVPQTVGTPGFESQAGPNYKWTWDISPCPDWESWQLKNLSGNTVTLTDLTWTSEKIPAPGSLAVLTGGALIAARRRRR